MPTPPLFLITVPEGPPPFTSQFIAGVAAAAQVPGMNAFVKVPLADAFANNFVETDYLVSLFPPTALLQFNIAALPLTPNAGITYRTLTLPLANNGKAPAPTTLPVIWDEGYRADFIQAFANLKAYLVAKGLMSRLFAVGFCPSCRLVNDGEYTIPSTNQKPYMADYSADWLAVGYSEAAVITALSNMAGGIAALFPGIYLMFAFLTSSQQKLGFTADPTSSFAASMMAGMVSAAAAVGGFVTPIQQSFTTTVPSSNFALSQGRLYGRLLLQLVPSYNTPGLINAGLAAALRLTNVEQIQIHYNQAIAAAAFIAALNEAPALQDANGPLLFAGGPLFSVVH